MAILVADTKKDKNESGFRKRVIYQSEALFANGNNIQRVQSVNYSFNVPRTDVNQYGQLGQIERVITEVPTVSMDFTYHLAGTTNETKLLGSGANGASFGLMKDLNNSSSNYYQQNFTVGLADEGVDYNNSAAHTNKAVVVPNGFLTSYSWTGAVGDVPSASVNLESTEMTVGENENQNVVTPESSSNPVVLRPGNVAFRSAPTTSTGLTTNDDDLPVMGFDGIHVQSFTVSVDVPRESIQRMGDRYEFARVITFPIQATMSIEAIISEQATSNLSDIVGSDTAQAPDPGFDIDVYCNKSDAGVAGLNLRFKNAKIEGHSVSSSIGSNKSITLDYAVQVDSGLYGYGNASASAGFFLASI
jgi:hypothetical protein